MSPSLISTDTPPAQNTVPPCPVVIRAGLPVLVDGEELPPISAGVVCILAALVEAYPGGLDRKQMNERSGQSDARKDLDRACKLHPALGRVCHYKKGRDKHRGVRGSPGLTFLGRPHAY